MNNQNGMNLGTMIQGLLTVTALLLLVVWLIYQLATSGYHSDASLATKEAIAARFKPIGDIVVTDAPVTAEGEGATEEIPGKKVYDSVCIACHSTGVSGAPKFGDKEAWAIRLKPGLEEVIKIATNGIRAMPPRGGFAGSDEEFRAAIQYMIDHSK